MTGIRARKTTAAQHVAWNGWVAARGALLALVAWFATGSAASALVITGGPTYSLPGGGSCTVGGVASQTGGATITCTLVSLASHTNVYFGARVDTGPVGNTMTGVDPPASSAALFRISTTAAGLITYTSTTTATSLSGFGTDTVSNKLNLTLTAGSASVVATGGTPANSGTNGDIANLFRLTSGSSFTFRADVRASDPDFAEGQACPAVYDPAHEDSGAGGDRSRVNVAFYFSDCGDGVVDSPEQCDQGGANGSMASCCTTTCTFKGTTSVCRNTTGECDPQEVCTGSSDTCPANAFTAPGTPCTDSSPPSGGNCKDAQCNGSGTCDQNFADETNGTVCIDGLFCNGTDTCQTGTCSGHSGDPCPGADGDGNCAESCNEASDNCLLADPNGSACTDGVFCNGTDTCSAGNCTTHTGDPCPGPDGDGDCSESCDESLDNCTLADLNGSACSDGLFCTGTETCSAGTCGSSTGDPCPGPDGDGDCSESCDESLDNCALADPNGSACTDGLFCNGTDTCSTGACTTHTGDPCSGPDGDGDCSESCDEGGDNCLANDPDGSACTDGLFCTGTETCTTGTCGSSTGDPCPGPDGDVNCAESCDEMADNCFADDPDGGVCRADTGSCDVQETCMGGSCPADAFEPSGTLCNPGSGDLCDTDEVCTGTSASCPSDTIAPSGTVCDPGSGDLCDPDEVCSGVADDPCPGDTVSPSGTVCNAGSGDICDPDEVCSGTAGDPCPSDTVTASGTTCRTGSGDSCDPDEACTGSADAACPADVVTPSGTVCNPGSGDVCDLDETCTGIAGQTCPADNFASTSTTCRFAAGVCDVSENCTGAADTPCPADQFEASSTVCRAAPEDCDVPENCTGNSAACPPDAFQPSGTMCGDQTDTNCDNPNTCDGLGGATSNCQQNYEPPSTICRPVADTCDVAEFCDGAGLCDPVDAVEPSGTVCRSDQGECDDQEVCDGVSAACPPDLFTANGTPCGDPSNTVCSNPDTCLNGACDPNNELTSFECRAASPGQACDVAENCDGAGNCPADGVAGSGTPCRAANGTCDVAEACDGLSSACPPDLFAAPGTACMSDTNPCTLDQCDGLNNCTHPAGNAGTLCRPDAGVCDVPENCNGLSTTCPPDGFEANGTSCDDMLFCNGSDTCNAGSCVSSGSPCGGGQTCSEASDMCLLGGCPTLPDSCIIAQKNQLVIKKDAMDSAKNKLIWKWLKGGAATQMDFADPINSAQYAFCLYVDASLQASATIPPGPEWKAIGDKGYKYKDKDGSADGVTKGLVKGTGAPDKSKAQIKGKGAGLPVAGLTLPFPMSSALVAQLRNNNTGTCLQGTFSAPLKNTDKQYKAKQ